MQKRDRIPISVIFPVALGTILNPLNSSMISVALVTIALDFEVSSTTVTWLISAFYLTASIGQPLMGRFADRFGPRRVFMVGMIIVIVSGIIGPLSPDIAWLVVARVIQALGTSAAFPSAVAVIRSMSLSRGTDVQAGLTVLSTMTSLSAAIGPFVGGLVIVLGGWQALFWLNVPLAAISLAAAWVWVPRDENVEHATVRSVAAGADAWGILLFSTFIVAVLVFFLSVTTQPLWWLLPVIVVSGIGFLWHEYGHVSPFINVRMLKANPALLGVYGHFVLFSIIFYCLLYGLPQWLEVAGGFTPTEVGLLIFPLAMMSGLMMPAVSWLIRRRGVRFTLVLSSSLFLIGIASLYFFNDAVPIWSILLVCAVLGVPNAMTNLGLQTRMYWAAVEGVGVASGLFQTARYLGGIFSMSVLGIVFAAGIKTTALHVMVSIMLALSSVVLVLSLFKSKADARVE